MDLNSDLNDLKRDRKYTEGPGRNLDKNYVKISEMSENDQKSNRKALTYGVCRIRFCKLLAPLSAAVALFGAGAVQKHPSKCRAHHE